MWGKWKTTTERFGGEIQRIKGWKWGGHELGRSRGEEGSGGGQSEMEEGEDESGIALYKEQALRHQRPIPPESFTAPQLILL